MPVMGSLASFWMRFQTEFRYEKRYKPLFFGILRECLQSINRANRV